MATILKLCLLGEQRVFVLGAAESSSLVVGRALELLTYLVVSSGVPQERERLAGLFWPESTDQQSRTNLRRELHCLRQLPGLKRSIEAVGTALLWRDVPDAESDVGCFRGNYVAAMHAANDGDTAELLRFGQAAIHCYTGELVPGMYDEWALAERAILHSQCVQVCDLVAAAAASSDTAQAIAAVQRRIQLEPLQELGYQTLMKLQTAAGDVAAAVGSYHRCADILESELGVEPGPRTREMAQGLLGIRPPRGRDDGHPVMRKNSVSTVASPVGRESEEAFLWERWSLAIAGEPGLVLLTGDAGVGKSRLLASLLARVKSRDAMVAYARCFGGAGKMALAPVADWLRQCEVRSPARAPDEQRASGTGLRVPATGTSGAATSWHGPTAALADAWQRHDFYAGLVRSVLAIGRPTLLVLDDVQWCDTETLEWLGVLLASAPSAPLLIVAAARADELASNLPLARPLQALREAQRLQDVAVTPLDASQTAALAGLVLKAPLSESDAALLHITSGGLPLHIVEAARSMRSCEGTETTLAEILKETGSGRGVLWRRFAQCSTPAQNAATLAAAVGREFSLALLARAWSDDETSLVRAVDELWRRRIICEHAGGYDFTHDLLRESAYELSTPPQRWLLHRRLAQAMVAEHAGGRGIPAELAEQYRRAGEQARAVDCYAAAGDEATRIFATAQALSDYQSGLDVLAELPQGGRTRETELGILLRMPPSLTAMHGYSAPRLQAILERILVLSQDLGRSQDQASALIGLFAVTFVQGQTQLSQSVALRALELAKHLPELRGQAHFAVGGGATSLGRPLEAVAHFDAACALAPDTHSYILGTRIEVHARAWSAHARWLSGDDAGAVALAAEAVDRATVAGHPFSLAVALAYQAVLLQLRLDNHGDCAADKAAGDGADREELAAVATALEALCIRYSFAYYGQWGAILRGWLTGREAGLGIIRQAIKELRASHALARMPYWQCLLAQTQMDCGFESEAQAVLAAAESLAYQQQDLWWLPEVLRRRALLAEATPARLFLARAEQLAEEQSSPWLAARVRATLAARNAGRTPAS